jgi:hypothetical protein
MVSSRHQALKHAPQRKEKKRKDDLGLLSFCLWMIDGVKRNERRKSRVGITRKEERKETRGGEAGSVINGEERREREKRDEKRKPSSTREREKVVRDDRKRRSWPFVVRLLG